jgi:hypothetical protein
LRNAASVALAAVVTKKVRLNMRVDDT